MKGYQPIMTFDEANAEIYDDLARRGDEEATVEFLDRLAGGGPAHGARPHGPYRRSAPHAALG
jgi:hypothetical protein